MRRHGIFGIMYVVLGIKDHIWIAWMHATICSIFINSKAAAYMLQRLDVRRSSRVRVHLLE